MISELVKGTLITCNSDYGKSCFLISWMFSMLFKNSFGNSPAGTAATRPQWLEFFGARLRRSHISKSREM